MKNVWKHFKTFYSTFISYFHEIVTTFYEFSSRCIQKMSYYQSPRVMDLKENLIVILWELRSMINHSDWDIWLNWPCEEFFKTRHKGAKELLKYRGIRFNILLTIEKTQY